MGGTTLNRWVAHRREAFRPWATNYSVASISSSVGRLWIPRTWHGTGKAQKSSWNWLLPFSFLRKLQSRKNVYCIVTLLSYMEKIPGSSFWTKSCLRGSSQSCPPCRPWVTWPAGDGQCHWPSAFLGTVLHVKCKMRSANGRVMVSYTLLHTFCYQVKSCCSG